MLPQHLAEHGAQRHRVDRLVEQIVTGPAMLLPHQRVSGTIRIHADARLCGHPKGRDGGLRQELAKGVRRF